MLSVALLDGNHWRERVREMRVFADDATDMRLKRRMLRIAGDYEKLAQRADERAAVAQK